MTVAAERLGRYQLVRLLGAGGMGELYLARADGIAGFAKLVALKRIIAHKASDERHIKMLLDEARLAASLQHPNIAQVYDVGFEAGQYFFAMEYVHGHDLRHVLHRAPGRSLQLGNCLHIAIGVCAGLHHAHEARAPSGASLGIVHRDVSPGNVIVSYDGGVKLVDFGVAKASTIVSQTRDGMVKGKYGYMSPEQCLGAPLDRRSDLFAVGILLWEMTLGRRLFKVQGELATLQRVVYVDAPRPSRYETDFPPALEAIIMRALARDPDHRYATAEEMQIDLEAFAVQHGLSASPVAMSREMNELFKDRIDAWHEAERLGRSLADHLADAAPEDSVSDDELDGVIGDLDTNVFSPEAISSPPGSLAGHALPLPPPLVARMQAAPASAAPPPPAVAEQPAPRRRWLPILIALLVTLGLGAAAAVYLLASRSEPATPVAQQQDPPPVEMTAGTGSQTAGSDTAGSATIQAEAPVVAQEVEPPDAAAESVEPAVAADASEPAAPAVTHAQSHGKPKPRAKSKDHAHDARPHPIAEKPSDRDEGRDASPHAEPPAETPAETHDASTHAPALPPPQAKPAVTAPAPGTVDAAGVRAVVRAHLGEIQECVSRARMDNRDLAGRVTMRIELSPAGAVTGTSIAASTGATPTLEACMRKVVAGWTFPAPAGGVAAAIRYPFAF